MNGIDADGELNNWGTLGPWHRGRPEVVPGSDADRWLLHRVATALLNPKRHRLPTAYRNAAGDSVRIRRWRPRTALRRRRAARGGPSALGRLGYIASAERHFL